PRLASHTVAHQSALLTVPRPPRSTLFPYTTLFRSLRLRATAAARGRRAQGCQFGEKRDDSKRVRGWQARLSPRLLVMSILNDDRSEEHTSELQSLTNLVCRLLLEKKNEIGRSTKYL